MSIKRKIPKRILAIVLVMTMLVGLLVMNASGATSNDSLDDAISNLTTKPTSSSTALELSGKNIYGDINMSELLNDYPNLERLEIKNTNVTNILNTASTNSQGRTVHVEATDTLYKGDRVFQTTSGASLTQSQGSGDLAVSKLIELVKIKKADGTKIDVPLEMLNAGKVIINGISYDNLDPETGVISGSVLSGLSEGSYNVTISFPIKYSSTAYLSSTTITLKIIKDYTLTPNPGTVYDGGSTVFTFTKNDGSTLSTSDYYFRLWSNPDNNLISTVDLSADGKSILITVSASQVTRSTGAFLRAYAVNDVSETTILASAEVIKASNDDLTTLGLKEYFVDSTGSRAYGEEVKLGNNITDPNSTILTTVGSTTGDTIHISGGTNISSKTDTNIINGIYKDTTMYLLTGKNGAYVPARYESQITVEVGYPDDIKAELVAVDTGAKEKSLALIVSARTLDAKVLTYAGGTVSSATDVPICVSLENTDGTKVGGYLNATTYGNSVKGYMVYQVPEIYQHKSQLEIEELIHNEDPKISLVAHYEIQTTNGPLVEVSSDGAKIAEGETLYLVGAAYYGNSTQMPYIVDINRVKDWYYIDVTASTPFTSANTVITSSAGTDSEMTAKLGAAPSTSSYIGNTKALQVTAGSYNTTNTDINKATLIFGPTNAPNYLNFEIEIIKKAIDSYIVVPNGYGYTPPDGTARNTTNIYQALVWEIEDYNNSKNSSDGPTIGKLYKLNELGEDTIAVGAANEYEVWVVYNNGSIEKVTNAYNNVVLQNATSETAFTGPSKGSSSANNFKMTASSGNVEGHSVQMFYRDSSGNVSSTIKLTIQGVDITGIYTVYQDYQGNFYSSDEALWSNADGIAQMPAGGLEVPAGTNKTIAYVLYKFSNEEFYSGMSETDWMEYALYNDYGTNTNRPIFSTLSHSGSLIAINDSTTSSPGANKKFIVSSGNTQGTTAVTAELDGINDAEVTVKLGSGDYTITLPSSFSKTDSIKVVAPVVKAVYADVDLGNVTSTTNPAANYTTLYSDSSTLKGFVPGDGTYTQPTVLLSSGDPSEWDGNFNATSIHTPAFDWSKEFLGDVSLGFSSDNVSTDTSTSDLFSFKVDSYSSSNVTLTYQYTYTLNGHEATETLYETLNPTTTPTVGAREYQLIITMQKPAVVDYYLVSDARINGFTFKNVYTQSYAYQDTIRVYPVVVSESINYDANASIPDNISRADVEGTSGAAYSEYLSYATTNDFNADAWPAALDLTMDGVTNGALHLVTKGVDDQNRIYYEYSFYSETFADVSSLTAINKSMVKIEGEPDSSVSNAVSASGQFTGTLPTASTTDNHLYFGHMVEPADAYVIDITATNNTPLTTTNAPAYVDIRYNLSASASATGGSEVNPEFFDNFDGLGVTMMPNSSNYNESYKNALCYEVLSAPTGGSVSVVYDSTLQGQLQFYGDTPGDYEIGFYVINKAGVRIPSFAAGMYRSITFTVEPSVLDPQEVMYGYDTSIGEDTPNNSASVVEYNTSYLDTASLSAGTLRMISNITTTPIATEVRFLDVYGNILATMKVTVVGTKVSAVEYNRNGTVSSPEALVNGGIHALYWNVTRETIETTPRSLGTTQEAIDLSTWTRIYPDETVDRNLDLNGTTLTASATDSGTIQYRATYTDSTLASPKTVDYWATIDASTTASYNYTISSSDSDLNQTVTDLDVGAGTTTPVYIWNVSGNALVNGIDYAVSDNTSAATVSIDGSYTVNVYAVANGNATITIYPTAGGVITLPVVVQQQVPTYPVSGTVKNESGVEVVGATVTLTNGTNTYTAKTDASGAYTVNVPDGAYNVTVTATGYVDGAETIAVSGSDATLNIVLKAPTYNVSGKVTDEYDNPLNGAKVVISDGVSFTKEVATDSSGSYAFTDVPRSSYAVTASYDGYSDNKADIVITSADLTDVNITLTYTGTPVTNHLVSGRVVDENGKPIEGATVILVSSDGTSYETKTNANGEYSFDVPEGSYELIIVADGYTDTRKDVVVGDSDVTVEEVQMSEIPLYNITLTVEDSSKAELDRDTANAGDTVTVTTVKIFGYDAVVTATDADGNTVTVEEKSKTVFEFVMPDSDVEVEVTFVEDNHNCPSALYTDLNLSGWYHEYTDYVLENGIMTGTSDNPKTFEPATSLTRAMIVEILYNVEGRPSVEGLEHTFADVKEGAWYGDAVAWAVNNKVIAGYSETQFGPTNLLTREEMVVILRNFAEYREYDFSASASLSKYTDAGSVSSWATTAMQWAVAEGLVEGRTATTIVPGGTSMRSEVATVITKFCRLYEIY